MRRFVAAVMLAGLVSVAGLVPSASAQVPGLQSFGFSGTTPFVSSSFFGPGPIQCQLGGYLTSGGVSPFFTASTVSPFLPPGPCTPPPFLFGGLGGLTGVGGLGVGGLGVGLPGLGGLASLTLAQAVALGIGTTATVGTVTTFTILGQTRALAAGQTLTNTTVGQLFPNLATLGLGGSSVTGLGLNTGLFGLGFPGLGLGFPGLGTANVTGGVTGTGTLTLGGRTCTVQGAFIVCQ